MKAADFNYHRAGSCDEAVRLLSEYDGNARILAGGQSLVPMLNMRLWRLGALVDINDIPGLDAIGADGSSTVLGPLVRYREIETSAVIAERLPLLATVVTHIGDRQVRNRGTIGGSLVQGDPTAEMALACRVLGATVSVVGPGGMRDIGMDAFYEGSYAAAIEYDEMVYRITFPAHPEHFSFIELCRRHGDFCVLSVAVTANRKSDGSWTDVRLGLGGVSDMPVMAEQAGMILERSQLSDADIEAAAFSCLDVIDPPDDMRASAVYRRHLVPVYVKRALRQMRDSTKHKS